MGGDGELSSFLILPENRGLIWHIWDGRKDGFGPRVTYHRLSRASLEKLTCG